MMDIRKRRGDSDRLGLLVQGRDSPSRRTALYNRTASPAYDVSSDARLLMVRRKNPVTPTRIRVVLNWPDGFGLDED